MAIIMIDCDDCYARANKLKEIGLRFADYADKLGAEGGELTEALRCYSESFADLKKDIDASTDIWADFYAHNIRLD